MRAALLALALLLAPGVAAAQPATPQPSSLQAVGIWGQKLVAAQQPVIDAYQKCSPLLQQVMGLIRTADAAAKESAARLIPEMRRCISGAKAAMLTTRDALNRVGRMPKDVEQQLHIDSLDVLRRSAVASEGMATYLERIEEVLDALAAGDFPLAQRKRAEAKAMAVSVIDGQIVLFETMRAGMPLDAHKAMFDIRITLNRATRTITVYDAASDNGQLSAALHGYGEDARSAAARLRAGWKRESKGFRSEVARSDDPSMTAMVVALDTAFEALAVTGDDVAAVLANLPSGRVPPADALHTLDRLAVIEVRILEAIRAVSNAATRTN